MNPSFSTGICNGTNTTCAGCDDIPNSGLLDDACGVCGGDGSTCTEIMATIPLTIASSQPTIWVIGAGLDDGSETVCGLYDPESGDLVVNTTGKYRPLLDTIQETGSLLPIMIIFDYSKINQVSLVILLENVNKQQWQRGHRPQTKTLMISAQFILVVSMAVLHKTRT